jgi:hypothetical protein
MWLIYKFLFPPAKGVTASNGTKMLAEERNRDVFEDASLWGKYEDYEKVSVDSSPSRFYNSDLLSQLW